MNKEVITDKDEERTNLLYRQNKFNGKYYKLIISRKDFVIRNIKLGL
jgi:hypothetical protein